MAQSREQYLASQRNQKAMRDVSRLAEQEGRQLMAVASNFDQQTMGGYVRSILPAYIDKYGNINAVAAAEYYNKTRAAAQKKLILQQMATGTFSRSNSRNAARQATRTANAMTKSQIALASGYAAKIPALNTAAKIDPIVGYVMQSFAKGGYDSAESSFVNASIREIAMANRDTILFNATLDEAIVGVQRVAEPDACAFCMMIALDSYGSPRISNYAADYHNHCHCSIEPIYGGQSAFKPDYYDQFNEDYQAGKANPGDGEDLTISDTKGNKSQFQARTTLQGIRQQTGRK